MLAIRNGRPGPTALTKFELERRLWQELGQSLSEFFRRPWREVEDYLAIIEISDREEQIRSQQAAAAAAAKG
jgi:hypothetical protein